MNTDTTKRYRSIKELFNWTTGYIVPIGELFEQIPNTQKYYNKTGWFVSKDACLNKDYFEEVLPVSEPVKKRIDVSYLGNHSSFKGNNHDSFWYQFCSNKVLGGTKFTEISNLLEKYLNGEMNNPAPTNNDAVEGKEPISTNNDDVPCLSLRDCSNWYEAWYPQNPMKKAFLNGLKQLVNQKLKSLNP